MNTNLSLQSVAQTINPLTYKAIHRIYKAELRNVPSPFTPYLLASIDILEVEGSLELLTEGEQQLFANGSNCCYEWSFALVQFRAAVVERITNLYNTRAESSELIPKPEPNPIDITQREQCLMLLAESKALSLLGISIDSSLAVGIASDTIRTALFDAVDAIVINRCIERNATPPTPRSAR